MRRFHSIRLCQPNEWLHDQKYIFFKSRCLSRQTYLDFCCQSIATIFPHASSQVRIAEEHFFSLNICNCTWNMYGNLFSVVFSIFAIHQITPTIECKVSVCASLFNSIWICIFAIFDCYAKCVFQWVCEGVGEGKTGKSRIWITWEGSTWGDAIVIAKVEMSELENNSQYSDAFVSLVYF